MTEFITGPNLVTKVTDAECVQCYALYSDRNAKYTFAYKRKEIVSSNFMIDNFC